ncbi:MAG: hypothetical protein NTX76_04080 [Alphaproteobacteria bacterium]|nr:hypothetical protein [Alphaproteobacteria bacterium]
MTSAIFDTRRILDSALKVNQHKAEVLAENLASRDIDGYARKEVSVNEVNINGNSFGVQTSKTYQVVDRNLVEQVRKQNGLVAEFGALDKFYQNIESLFGSKGSGSSFAHSGNAFANAVQSLAAQPTSGQRLNMMTALNRHVQDVSSLANKIQDLRAQVDQELSADVSTVNALLGQLADTNERIVQGQGGSEDSSASTKRQLVHQLSGFLGNRITPYESLSNGRVATDAERPLVQGNEASSLTYVQSVSVNVASVLSPITLSGFGLVNVDITAEVQQSDGKLKALLELRDTILPGLQAQVDEYTKNFRDSVNAIHNLGTSTQPPTVLTGTVGVPGAAGPLTNATVISGLGTIRVGVIDPVTGNLANNAAQINLANPLGPVTTVGGLVAALNGANAGFTAQLTPTGQLQLTATNPAHGVSIGSLNGPAMMNAGNPYNAANAYNFSHFFGLNNILQTGGVLPGQPPAGISNALSIRPDIVSSNGATISLGKLSEVAAINQQAIAPGDISVVGALSNKMRATDLTFNATVSSPQITTSLLDYSANIIAIQMSFVKDTHVRFEAEQYTYEGLSSAAFDVSGVDPRQVLQDSADLAMSENLIIAAMQILNNLDKKLLELS